MEKSLDGCIATLDILINELTPVIRGESEHVNNANLMNTFNTFVKNLQEVRANEGGVVFPSSVASSSSSSAAPVMQSKSEDAVPMDVLKIFDDGAKADLYLKSSNLETIARKEEIQRDIEALKILRHRLAGQSEQGKKSA